MDIPADRNVTYLLLTVLIIATVAGLHNLTVTEDQAISFGLCDTSIACIGVDTAGYCLGVEYKQVSCIDPATAPEYRRAEAECGLDAQGICNENPDLTGLAWTQDPRATYNGTTCSQWAETDERVDLLTCEDTFTDVTRWQNRS